MRAATKEKDYPQREVDFTVMVVFPKNGVREISEARCQLLNLSEGDAFLRTGGLQSIPDFFYLQFEAGVSKNIGCYAAERGAETIYARFLRELETPLLERVIAENSVLSLLDSIWPDSGGGGTPTTRSQALTT